MSAGERSSERASVVDHHSLIHYFIFPSFFLLSFSSSFLCFPFRFFFVVGSSGGPSDPHGKVNRTFGENGPPVEDLEDETHPLFGRRRRGVVSGFVLSIGFETRR